jgi:hypothetical protein
MCNECSFVEDGQRFSAQLFQRDIQMIINSLSIPSIEFIAILQTNEGVRLVAQGMLDALQPIPIQGD